jgi:uncharacterized YccA/Bax inhibitor family protein
MSHNPVFNRALQTGVEQARFNVSQQAVDAEFAKITSSAKMTVEGTAVKVGGLFVVLLASAAVGWYLQLTALVFPAMLVGLGVGLWATFGK